MAPSALRRLPADLPCWSFTLLEPLKPCITHLFGAFSWLVLSFSSWSYMMALSSLCRLPADLPRWLFTLLEPLEPRISHPFGTFSRLVLSFSSWSYMMLDPRLTCSSQAITTKGLGRHFTSPWKPRDKKKSWMTVPIPGHASKWQKLLNELQDLLAASSELKQSPSSTTMVASPILQPDDLFHPDKLLEVLKQQ